MLKKRNRRGFTMAELLVVIGIIGVLAAVAFIAVAQRERSLNRLERDATARELFIAAQNHLTMAEGQGYLGITDFGSQEKNVSDFSDSDEDIYYLVYPAIDGYSATATPQGMLDLMLPFGAVDETVRAGGSYVIRYNRATAIVTDVFYCSTNAKKYNHPFTGTDAEYNTLFGSSNKYRSGAGKRNNYEYDSAVLGWYGGEDAGKLDKVDTPLKNPEIVVINAETLRVAINDGDGNNASLKLIIRGNTSGAEKSFLLKTNESDKTINLLSHNPDESDRLKVPEGDDPDSGYEFVVTLDDITSATMHFDQLNSEATALVGGELKTIDFIPGEDITIQAVAYDNTRLTNVAYSAKKVANSLYERIEAAETVGEESWKAYINNFRHLENLHSDISGIGDALAFNSAEQTTDLSWPGFIEAIEALHDETTIDIYFSGDELNTDPATGENLYVPVSPYAELTYDGKGFSISGVEINYSGADDNHNDEGCAGLFGTSGDALNVRDLVLVDFKVQGTGDVGVLAGSLPAGSSVTNVLAYNSIEFEGCVNIAAAEDNATGSVGGLVGSIAEGSIQESAAALYVAGNGNAGGLVGAAVDTSITASYSGGHTLDGMYSGNTDSALAAAKGLVNVIGGTAGGLVGSTSGSTSLSYCYSTCSAYGDKAGGLIGEADGNVVNACYAAGLVLSDKENGAKAFLGGGTLDSGSANCYYVDGINGMMESGADIAIPFDTENTLYDNPENTGANPVALAFPNDVESRAEALPYDATLVTTFEGRYAYLSIALMGYEHEADSNGDDFNFDDFDNSDDDEQEASRDHLARHYGDWQMPLCELDLLIDNSEYLTAKVALPIRQIENVTKNWSVFNLYMLVRGASSGDEAFLVFSLTPPPETTPQATPGGGGGEPATTVSTYALALEDKSLVTDRLTADSDVAVFQQWLDDSGSALDDPRTAGESDAAYVTLNVNFDRITSPGGHFKQLFPGFIPGEDLTVAVSGGFGTQLAMEDLIDSDVHSGWLFELTDSSNNATAGSSGGDQASGNGASADSPANGEASSNANTADSPANADSPAGGGGASGGAGATRSAEGEVSSNAVMSADKTRKYRAVVATTNSLFADPRPAYSLTVGFTYPIDDAEAAQAAPTEYTEIANNTAAIGNLRHIENLDGAISGLATVPAAAGSTPGTEPAFEINTAKQIVDLSPAAEGTEGPDLSWPGFIAAVYSRMSTDDDEDGGEGQDASRVKVYTIHDEEEADPDDLFLPACPDYALAYDGQGHSITGVKADAVGAAGLFGTLKAGSGVSNLQLVGFDIATQNDASANPAVTTCSAGALAGVLAGTGTGDEAAVTVENVEVLDATVKAAAGSGNAGGLVGSAKYATITNALARNTAEADDAEAATVTSGPEAGNTADATVGGGAGGLVGVMDHTAVEKCAAALVVSSARGDAGGLLGKANAGSAIKASYSGGHAGTVEETGAVVYSDEAFNVTAATGVAGGLVGTTNGAEIEYSYSTCSASGATAGGFVGKATAGSIDTCYATGLVKGVGASSKAGAFAGELEGNPTISGSLYFESVNDLTDANGYATLAEVSGGEGDINGVTALDESEDAYNAFSYGEDSDYGWKPAVPYNEETLKAYYNGVEEGNTVPVYNLKTVSQLGATGVVETASGTDTVADFVATHYGDWPVPEIFVLNAGTQSAGGGE